MFPQTPRGRKYGEDRICSGARSTRKVERTGTIPLTHTPLRYNVRGPTPGLDRLHWTSTGYAGPSPTSVWIAKKDNVRKVLAF